MRIRLRAPIGRAAGALLPLLAALASACEESAPAAPVEETPVVGLAELPIALRNAETRPTDAFRIELSPVELRLDGEKVVDLAQGSVPAEERDEDVIAKLHSRLRAGVAKRTATVRMHVNVPYETMALLLSTLQSARVRRVAFEVRKPGPAMDTGWLVLDDFLVQAKTGEPVAFEGELQHGWDELVAAWDTVYEACRAGDYVGCDKRPDVNVARGGQVEVSLFARGSALRAAFRRFGEAAEGPARGPALLEGVAAAPRPEPLEGPDGEPLPPTEEAVFTFNYDSAVRDPAAIASAFRPLCGATRCGVVVRGDRGTGSMRLVSFLGAAFPNGTTPPRVVFELPSE